MAFPNGGVPDMGQASPFQANTRIVAVIALTIAGLFVFLGLVLSLLRAVQQRAAERVCLPAELFELTKHRCHALMILLVKTSSTVSTAVMLLPRQWCLISQTYMYSSCSLSSCVF